MSLPLARCGFTVIMLKPDNNPHARRVLLRLARERMPDALASEGNAACFFDHQALCIMNSLLKVRQSRFLSGCFEMLQDAVQRKQPEMWEAGSSLTIMRLLTQHCQLDNSWQNIQFLPFHNPLIHLTSPLLTSFYSVNSKLLLRKISDSRRHHH
jgi:hypothetical protein